MQTEMKQTMEIDKLSAMFDQLKCSEESLRQKSENSSKEIERLKQKMERGSQMVSRSSFDVRLAVTAIQNIDLIIYRNGWKVATPNR